MEALPFVSWFKDADGFFSLANTMLLETYQKELSEIIGKRNQDVFDEADAQQNEIGDKDVQKPANL